MWGPIATDRLRQFLRAETRLLREVFAFRRTDPAVRIRLRQMRTDAGLLQTCMLSPTPTRPRRAARLLVQPDGDVMLFLPPDFGVQAEDARLVTRLHDTVAAELRTLHNALPYNWVALITVVLHAGLSLVIIWGSAQSVSDWQQAGALLQRAWQQPIQTPAALTAALWHAGEVLRPVIAAICSVLGLRFARVLRLGLVRGILW